MRHEPRPDMKKFATLDQVQAAAPPGAYIMASYSVVTRAERDMLLRNPDAVWSVVRRQRPFHDAAAELESGWADLDDAGLIVCVAKDTGRAYLPVSCLDPQVKRITELLKQCAALQERLDHVAQIAGMPATTTG